MLYLPHPLDIKKFSLNSPFWVPFVLHRHFILFLSLSLSLSLYLSYYYFYDYYLANSNKAKCFTFSILFLFIGLLFLFSVFHYCYAMQLFIKLLLKIANYELPSEFNNCSEMLKRKEI